jgi:hypothetical protein
LGNSLETESSMKTLASYDFERQTRSSGYDTNLAAEFYVLSILHRLGMSATLTLGNKKSVDIVITRDAGDAITVDVKGLAGTTSWPIDNIKEGRDNHFIVFVTFLGKISDPREQPEVYVVPSKKISGNVIYQNPRKNRRVLPLGNARKFWKQYEHGWELLR